MRSTHTLEKMHGIWSEKKSSNYWCEDMQFTNFVWKPSTCVFRVKQALSYIIFLSLKMGGCKKCKEMDKDIHERMKPLGVRSQEINCSEFPISGLDDMSLTSLMRELVEVHVNWSEHTPLTVREKKQNMQRFSLSLPPVGQHADACMQHFFWKIYYKQSCGKKQQLLVSIKTIKRQQNFVKKKWWFD